MLITGIKSKPTYTSLALDETGKFHLLVAQGSGGEALLRLLRSMQGARHGSDATHGMRILYASESISGNDYAAQLTASPGADVAVFPTIAALVDELRERMAACAMGTRLYLTGSESFLGVVLRVADEYGLNRDEIQQEQCGTLARRVHCMHCNTATENVKTNIALCAGCKRTLLVRDHYSRRLAAYMGVNADAECPGSLPAVEEVFR